MVVILLALAGLVGYAIETYILIPSQVNIVGVTLKGYIDGVPFPNGTLLDWGNVTLGDIYYFELTLENVGSTPINVYCLSTGTPFNCTHSWAPNGTSVLPNANATAPLYFISGDNATVGLHSMFYTWTWT